MRPYHIGISIKDSSSSVASILTDRRRVHDAAPGDAVLGTPPGRVEAKVLRNKVLDLNQVSS